MTLVHILSNELHTFTLSLWAINSKKKQIVSILFIGWVTKYTAITCPITFESTVNRTTDNFNSWTGTYDIIGSNLINKQWTLWLEATRYPLIYQKATEVVNFVHRSPKQKQKSQAASLLLYGRVSWVRSEALKLSYSGPVSIPEEQVCHSRLLPIWSQRRLHSTRLQVISNFGEKLESGRNTRVARDSESMPHAHVAHVCPQLFWSDRGLSLRYPARSIDSYRKKDLHVDT